MGVTGEFMGTAKFAAIALAATTLMGWNWPGEGISLERGIVPESAQAAETRSGDMHVDFRSFHDRLAPYGTWINHRRWGAVWRPHIRRGFHPYRDGGHWEDTADYGTVWVSDYSWGDIPFHYGRWFFDPEEGWVWIPGYVWGPAWVVWRAGAGDVGWMPMPPMVNYDGYGDFPDDWNGWYGYASFGYRESTFDGFWSFVNADDLYAPSVAYYVIGPAYYPGIIRRTVGWTRFSIYNGHVFNRSIDRNRFRTTFGHDLRPGKRHDFAGRLGPVVDYRTGKAIDLHERGAAHALPAISTRGREGHSAGTGRTSVPVAREHGVNVYRGGSISTHHTTTSQVVHPAVSHRTTTVHHSTSGHSVVHHTTTYRIAPAGHPATTSHPTTGGAPHAPPAPPHRTSPPPNESKPH